MKRLKNSWNLPVKGRERAGTKGRDTHRILDPTNLFGLSRPIIPGDPLVTMARSRLLDVSIIRWYHCITRCVRRAFLLAEGPVNRKG
jgi:hypothetical protein